MSGYNEGPRLVIAGAGKEKADALSHHAAHLMLSGVGLQLILALILSRRLSDKMAVCRHA